jgi:uncharacterized protein (UPF0179 family)
MYQEKGKTFLSDEDQCNSCRHKDFCPLLEAVVARVVAINNDEMLVKNCGMHLEAKLKVIKKPTS